MITIMVGTNGHDHDYGPEYGPGYDPAMPQTINPDMDGLGFW